MTSLGIVGSEAAKFTPESEALARLRIAQLLNALQPDRVVSGGCHLGGIDAWAAEIAHRVGIDVVEHLPRKLSWAAGYKPRNLLIARDSDALVCITVRQLPEGYTGMRFGGCYHCGTPPEHHVKSGGCWTMKQAAQLGKKTRLVVIG